MSEFEFANAILTIAMGVIPVVLGAGFLIPVGHALYQTAKSLATEGVQMLKLGAGILGGAVLGAVGGAVAGIKAGTAAGFGTKETLKIAGGEMATGAIKGAVQGVRGSMMGVMFAEKHARELMEKLSGGKKVTYSYTEKVGDRTRTVTISRPALDMKGRFSTREERVSHIDAEEPEKKPERRSPLILPGSPEWEKGMAEINKREYIRKTKGESAWQDTFKSPIP